MLQRLLCLMLCLSLLPFSAVQADDAVTQVEELLQSVPKTDSLENQQLRESYQQALQYARDAQRYREQGKAYQQILIDYPKESARLKESLHNYQPQPRPPLSSLKEEALRQAIGLIEADYQRSADTHLIPLPLPGFAQHGIDLYLKDESTHPTGSLKHRLARSLFLYALCNGWVRQGSTIVEASSGSTAVSEAYFARLPEVAGAIADSIHEELQ